MSASNDLLDLTRRLATQTDYLCAAAPPVAVEAVNAGYLDRNRFARSPVRERDSVDDVLVVEAGHGQIFHAGEAEINHYALDEGLVVIHRAHASGFVPPKMNAESGHCLGELGALKCESKYFSVMEGRPVSTNSARTDSVPKTSAGACM